MNMRHWHLSLCCMVLLSADVPDSSFDKDRVCVTVVPRSGENLMQRSAIKVEPEQREFKENRIMIRLKNGDFSFN